MFGNRFVNFVTILLMLTLCLSSTFFSHPLPLHASSAQQSATISTTQAPVYEPLEDTLARLDALAAAFKKLRRQLDPSQIDIDALAFTLDNDPTQIIDWVRQQIAFEQYPGLLRGSRGTLIGRAGNALDTAMLLNRLLTDAGFEVRIAHGQLTEADATNLVKQMWVARPDSTTTSPGDPARLRSLLLQLGKAYNLSQTETEAIIDRALQSAGAEAEAKQFDNPRLQSEQTLILDALDNAKIPLGDEGAIAALITEAQDYFWVEYRLSSSQTWNLAHPAFKEVALAPKKLKTVNIFGNTFGNTFRDTVPTEYLHRIRIEVSIEQKIDQTLTTQSIMPAWERPVATLIGQPLIYRNTPVSLKNLDELLKFDEFLAKPTVFVPNFANQLVQDGLAFDLNGSTFDVTLLNNGGLELAQLSQQFTGGLEQATGALDSATNPQAASDLITLSAAWIDYTLIAPNGTEHTTRCMILDRIGAKNRAAGLVEIAADQAYPAAAASLFTQHTILVMPANYSQSYVAQRYIDRTLNQIEVLKYLRKQLPFSDAPFAAPPKTLPIVQPFDDVLLNLLFANPPHNNDSPDTRLISYRPAPALIVLEDGMKRSGTGKDGENKGYLRVDVISNPRRSYRSEGDTLVPDPLANILAGVWETYAEESPFAEVVGNRFSTFAAFAGIGEKSNAVNVIAPAESSRLDALEMAAESKAAIQRDLNQGYVVLLPSASASQHPSAGWWRVNPRTGETLGLTDDGRGNSVVEYSFLLEFRLGLLSGAPSSLLGYAICKSQGNSAACCAADAAVAWGAGAGMGAAAAKVSATAAIFLSEGLKFYGIAGGIAGVVPSFCSISAINPK